MHLAAGKVITNSLRFSHSLKIALHMPTYSIRLTNTPLYRSRYEPELRSKCGGTHKFSGINVQTLTMNSGLQLYAVLLPLPDLRCGLLNSEVFITGRLYRPENVVLHRVNF